MTEFIHEFGGYVVQWGVFGQEGDFIRGWRDEWFSFREECFEESLKQNREIILCQDFRGGNFARTSDGTMRFASDSVGLIAHVKLIDTPENRLLVWKIDNHHVRGWSHRWRGDWSGCRAWEKDGIKFREHFKAELLQVAIVVHKVPRMLKSCEMFLYGGPPGSEADHAAARIAADPTTKLRTPVLCRAN